MRNKMNAAERMQRYEEKIYLLEEKNIALEANIKLYQQRYEQYQQAYEQLEHLFNELRRHRFGKKSERFIDDENNPQLSFFAPEEMIKGQDALEKEITVGEHKRSHSKKKDKEQPTRIEIIPVSEAERQCACGSCKTVISYETKKLIHYERAIQEVIEQRREIVACPKGCDGSLVTAKAPLHILPKAKATEEFLAFLVTSKMDDRQPLYHLEKQLKERHGINCSRQTMAKWLIDLISPLTPIYNLLKDYLIEYDVASCDPTTLQVLKEPGRLPETKSYFYCFRGGPPGCEVILYNYNDKEHKQFVIDWFTGFKGYLQVDGDHFFDLIGTSPDVVLVNCNAHSRRKFEPIAKNTKGKGLAKEALKFYKALYKIEREAKNNHLSPYQRHELRQAKSKPLLDQFKQWLDNNYPTVLPQSPLGKAMFYCLNRWEGLIAFLKDGRLEIDNNQTEQQIKPFVIARKNFLFAASVEGAKALSLHFSLVRTAKYHGHDPYHYYVKLLKNIPYCKTIEDYEKLLPWNIKSNYLNSS